MARDCPERKRGQDWRNDDRGSRNAPRIGGTENELDAFMAEMGGSGANGRPQQAIEYNGGGNDGDGERNLKPWERGPTGGAAPWARGGSGRDDRDNGSNATAPWAPGGASYNQSGYSAAPWGAQAPPPPGGASYGYGNYGGYDANAPPGAPPGMNSYGAPGYGAAAAPSGPPPGLGPLFQNYGAAGSPPPPPPPSDLPPPPPPPPSDIPPPPPPPV